jgi:RNA-directed DNA polymerase
VNTGAPSPTPSIEEAEARVLGILFNLVCDPAVLLVAWRRVRGNKGARTAGVDGQTVYYIQQRRGEESFLAELRADLKARRFGPLPVRERLIPKPGSGKLRMLGIPTVRDRVVQAALKLVLEPIFEADFLPCSYGFRPGRRAQDAIAEIHVFTSPPHVYEWIVEGDIQACFDEIDHAALLGRVRRRIADKRVLTLVKAFLKAGILSQDGAMRDTITGTPQGGILSPLLANIALGVLDQHLAGRQTTTRAQRRRGQPSIRLIRYADDWVVLVRGTRAHAETLRDETATALAPMGLRLSAAKTRTCHIDEGFDFLGFRIQRQPKKHHPGKRAVYTWPSKKALAAVKAKVRALTRAGSNQPLAALLGHLNRALRGWTAYFCYGVSKRTFDYLGQFTWNRVLRWLRRKHPKASWGWLRRRYLPRWWPTHGKTALLRCGHVTVLRYRYRGAQIPTPWTATG